MLHTIHDEIYDLNKQARGHMDIDDVMNRIYSKNEEDITHINNLMLEYVKNNATKDACVDSYILSRTEIENLNVIKRISASYEHMMESHKTMMCRLLMADILEYYSRLSLFAHFDDKKCEVQFDLPY